MFKSGVICAVGVWLLMAVKLILIFLSQMELERGVIKRSLSFWVRHILELHRQNLNNIFTSLSGVRG